jgi:hypothetical protein
MSKLCRLAKKENVTNPLDYSLEEAKRKLQEITSKYWTFKNSAKEVRETFLEGKAAAIAVENNQDKLVVIKQLIRREKQRESERRIKYTLGQIRGRGITRVEVEAQDGTIREVTMKVGIERKCMIEN